MIETDRNRQHEARLYEAIAAGFKLPIQSIKEVVWPAFWRRAVVRCGPVGMAYDDNGWPRERTWLPSRVSPPPFPWVMHSGIFLCLMLRAACAVQHDPPAGALVAIARCEQALDDALEAWLAGMELEHAAWVRGLLGSWADAPEPIALLDAIQAQAAFEIRIGARTADEGLPLGVSVLMSSGDAPGARRSVGGLSRGAR